MSIVSRPPPFTIFWKYFCAWERTCTVVREFTTSATLVHFLPYMSRPWRNRSCSSCVQRPAFSFAAAAAAAADDDEEEEEEEEEDEEEDPPADEGPGTATDADAPTAAIDRFGERRDSSARANQRPRASEKRKNATCAATPHGRLLRIPMDWHPRDRKLRLDPSAADIFSSLSSKIQYQEKDLDQFPPPQLIFLEVISGSIFQKNLSCPHFLGVLGFHFFGKFDRKLSSPQKKKLERGGARRRVRILFTRPEALIGDNSGGRPINRRQGAVHTPCRSPLLHRPTVTPRFHALTFCEAVKRGPTTPRPE